MLYWIERKKYKQKIDKFLTLNLRELNENFNQSKIKIYFTLALTSKSIQ